MNEFIKGFLADLSLCTTPFMHEEGDEDLVITLNLPKSLSLGIKKLESVIPPKSRGQLYYALGEVIKVGLLTLTEKAVSDE